tara:strand:- start:1020 stop:1559 length:540 start_codon:yes stop_codon:yes gene_type:complete
MRTELKIVSAMCVLAVVQCSTDIPIHSADSVTVKDTVSCPLDTVSCPTVSSKTQAVKELTWDDFVQAVIYVESRGDNQAYNKKEKALGCLQIRPIMVREVNRILRKHKVDLRFELSDREDRLQAIAMFDIMAEEVECCLDLTQMEFFEIVARKWNGGPRGHKKKSTQAYWERIKNQLNK